MHRLLVLPGDGQDTTSAAEAARIVQTVADVDIHFADIGFKAYEKYGEYAPLETLEEIERANVILCGPVLSDGKRSDDAVGSNLGIFAKFRRFVAFDGNRFPDLDVTVWGSLINMSRDIEESKDLEGFTISKFVRSSNYNRIMDAARADMDNSGYRKVSCIARSDLFPETSRMFYEAFDEAFKDSDMEQKHENILAAMAGLVANPKDYQCMIVADLYTRVAESVLEGMNCGGRFAPYTYVGEERTIILPEGKNMERGSIWSPMAAALSAVSALHALGEHEVAERVLGVIKDVVSSGVRTWDLEGTSDSNEFMEVLLSRLHADFNMDVDDSSA